jgi:hypothetical protein
VWVWDNAFPSAAYGVSGSVVNFCYDFAIRDEIPDVVLFDYACDNAAVVYVNGVLAGNTSVSMRGDQKDETAFGGLTFADFDGSQWVYTYTIDIANYLQQGDNSITIFAANSASTTATGTINDGYNATNNPAGLIFNCVFDTTGAVFNNNTNKKYDVIFKKTKVGGIYNGPAEKGEFSFDLFKIDESPVVLIGTFEVRRNGIVKATELVPGTYQFREKKHNVWELKNPNALTFTIYGTEPLGEKIRLFGDAVVNKPILDKSYGSVTATNKGNQKAIHDGLNKKNGNPYYGDKNNPDTPYVVPNSNHFVFAELNRASLVNGVFLDMMVGNNFEVVGQALVKLVNDKLEITMNGEGKFGAIAFNRLPVFNNGNIHSQKVADLAKFGAMTGFNHDINTSNLKNTATIPCPAGDTIYLYIHCDPIQFYKAILAW